MKPRSLSVSPPQEYTARHQQGNRVGSAAAMLLAMIDGDCVSVGARCTVVQAQSIRDQGPAMGMRFVNQ